MGAEQAAETQEVWLGNLWREMIEDHVQSLFEELRGEDGVLDVKDVESFNGFGYQR